MVSLLFQLFSYAVYIVKTTSPPSGSLPVNLSGYLCQSSIGKEHFQASSPDFVIWSGFSFVFCLQPLAFVWEKKPGLLLCTPAIIGNGGIFFRSSLILKMTCCPAFSVSLGLPSPLLLQAIHSYSRLWFSGFFSPGYCSYGSLAPLVLHSISLLCFHFWRFQGQFQTDI